ncbi:substrate-binding domain-containing protein [Sorangium sp. So ce1036]|uniref:substrate-binding domain-containing protein n=1 Tax=Sorangium sp. So ce1036 TaxID=3133328 RepID=UPI003EFFE439
MTRTGRCWMTALGLMLTTAACGSSDTAGSDERAEPIKRAPTVENEFTPVELEATIDALVARINESSLEPMQMAVLVKSIDGFFAPVATGAGRAMGELGATGNVVAGLGRTGELEQRVEHQNEQIRQAVAGGTEGIGIAPFGQGNAAVIDEAVEEGIHVVTLDTDLKDSRRSIYVGTINESAGATAGRTLLEELPEGPGTVILHGSTDQTWADGMDRTRGAQEVLSKAGYTVVVSSVIWSNEKELDDVEAMKTAIVAADPPVVGMLGLFSVSYRCAMAAEAADQPGLPIVAFDFDPKTVGYMRQGRIKATHVQRQYYEGYLVPYILYGMKSIGLEATRDILARHMVDETRFDLGIDVVPGDKVDDYNAFLDSIGANQ